MRALYLIILSVLSLLTGVICFTAFKYDAATVVVHAKSFEEGMRTIQFVDGGGSTKHRDFIVGNTDGASWLYPVDGPRSSVRSVRIPPLAAPGKFEIVALSLENSAITYHWDSALACTQRQLKGELLLTERCNSNGPAITQDTDGSVDISAIPEAGSVTPPLVRTFLAAATALLVFLCGLYLLMPLFHGAHQATAKDVAVRGCQLLVVLLFLYQLIILWRYSVDIPYYEEWEFFDALALPNGISWQWLSQQVSHQRMMVFTKLMAWVNLELFSLNFKILKMMNYAVFGGVIFAVARFKNRVVGPGQFQFFPLFLVFMMSPIIYEVHAASFQSGETFAVLFSLIMLIYAIPAAPSHKATMVFSIAAILGMCSLSAGFVYAVVFLAIMTAFTAIGIKRGTLNRSPGLRNLLLAWGMLIPGVCFWLYGFKKPDPSWGVPQWLLPSEAKFWDTYLDLLSFGFGFESEYPVTGIVCLTIVLVPVVLLLCDKSKRWERATWQILTAILGTLAVIGLLVVGRGNMPFSIKVSRYAIFGYMLIPYASIAWWLALKSKKQQTAALLALWSFCGVAYIGNWDYGIYEATRQQELSSRACVEQYAIHGGDGVCPSTYLLPVGKFYDNAKKLNVSFTRPFQ